MVLPKGNRSFWDEEGKGSCEEYMFDVSAETMGKYTIHGHFFTCQNLVKGDWEVKLVIEQEER